MAYTAGDTILDDEYNTFVTGNAAGTGDNSVNNVNTLWGAGTTDKGYGETGSTLASVSAGSTITATQWNNFLTRIENIAAHQGSTVTNYSSLSAGNTIEALSTVATDLGTITTSRMDAAASGSTVTTGGSSSRTSNWTTTVATTQRVAFASADALRYFFNAGGLVQMSYSRSGGTSSNKNTEWTDLCNKMGTITLSGSTSHTVNGTAYTGVTQTGGGAGGSGSSKASIDAYDLTTSLQQLIIKYADTAPYTANYIKIEALVNGANLDIKTSFVDAAADTGNPSYPAPGTNPASLDIVNGTLTSTMKYINPDDTYLTSAAWGTPTMSTTEAL
jgi:hypothetical protein